MAENRFCQYAWVAKSNDGSYEDYGVGFLDKRACYQNMRNAVLGKMKWNTEWEDVTEDESVIDYKVSFSPDTIVHESFSGTYTYLIVMCDSEGNLEPDAWAKLADIAK